MRQVGYRPNVYTADTGRMPTKAIWDNIPWSSIEDGEQEGMVFFDDFINVAETNEDTTATGKYAVMQDTGGTNTFAQGAGDEFGSLSVALDGTDEEEAWISTGGNTGGLTEISLQATRVPHTVAFEARVKKSAIATGAFFVGLADPGRSVANTVVDATGVFVTTANMLGFHVLEATPTAVDFRHQAASVTPVTDITAVDTLVADTYAKLGFIYNYKNRRDQQIKVYVDGVLSGTYITKAVIDSAGFPGDVDLALLFGGKCVTAVAQTMTMDWWKVATVVNA